MSTATAPGPAELGTVRSKGALEGTVREYETVVIVRPQLNKPLIAEFIQRFSGVLERNGARLTKLDSWGMRILSYPIKHSSKGIYLYWRYVGGSDIVAEFERNLRIHDAVLRYYSVKVDEDVDPEARPSEITPEVLDAATEPGPDPEELLRKQREAEERARIEAEAAAAARAARGESYLDDDDDDDQDEED